MKTLKFKKITVGVALAISSVTLQAAPEDLDTSFSTDGYHTQNYGANFGGSSASYFQDVAVTPSDKIIAVGHAKKNSFYYQGVVVKYNANGSVDTSFAGGIKRITSQADLRFTSVAIQADGKILIGGHGKATTSSQWNLNIWRLNTDGTLDSSFANNGEYSQSLSDTFVQDVAINSDGEILISVSQKLNRTGYLQRYSASIIKLDASGNLDTSFGNSYNGATPNGRLIIDSDANSSFEGRKITLDATGKIYLPGIHSMAMQSDFSKISKTVFLQQIKADGNYIYGANLFSNSTNRWTLFNGQVRFSNNDKKQELTSSVVLPSGEIVSAGCDTTNASPLRIHKQTASSSYVSSFGTSGVFRDAYNDVNDCINDLNYHPSIGIVAVGNSEKPLLLLVDEDTGIKSASKELTMNGNFRSVVTLGDGKIVAVGETSGTPKTSLIAVFQGSALPAPSTINTLTFADQNDALLSTSLTATANNNVVITPTGSLPATVVDGEIVINSASPVTGSVTLNDGDVISLEHTSASTASTDMVTEVIVSTATGFSHNNKSWTPGLGADISFTFTSTTEGVDTIPDAFNFGILNAFYPVNTVQASNITISGINSSTPITITNGDYSVNGGPFTSANGLVNDGDTVRVRHVTSNTFSTQNMTTLNVGGVTESLITTTESQDTTPNVFGFAPLDNANLNASVQAGFAVSGINDATPISIVAGQYRIGSGAFTSANGMVNNGDVVTVRHTTSSNFNSTVTSLLTIGGVTSDYVSTTVAQDTTPNAFSFTDALGVLRNTPIEFTSFDVLGITGAVPISVTNGEYKIGSGTYTSVSGTVSNGDNVTVRHTNNSGFGVTIQSSLTIGTVTENFRSTTETGDNTPNMFTFANQADVELSTELTSDSITISGINTNAPVTISAGEYSINGGEFTDAAGNVENGDEIEVRHTSAASNETATVTELTIGGVVGEFTTTTKAAASTGNGGTGTEAETGKSSSGGGSMGGAFLILSGLLFWRRRTK